ncbi:hypothetical protein AAG906_021579 [Vitis piasezkii]
MNFMSYEHLVEECPTIPVVREMFGDCNTYNSNWRDHPNFSWKPQPPQYKQHVQATQQASNLEQAMVNLSKVMGDFVGAQKSINAHLSQRIDSVESSLNKMMDEVQNDLSQKIDNLQDSISRFANLNTVQEKGNFPSQPYQNSKGIHEVVAKKGESSMVKEVKMVITLSGKEEEMQNDKKKEEKREFWPLVLLPLSGHIWSTLSSLFYTYYIPFRSLGSQESNLWSLQENCTELSGNFTHLNPSPTCGFECENFTTVGRIFEALPGAQIMHMIYHFEAWEVRNSALQTTHDLDLKRRRYGHLKTTKLWPFEDRLCKADREFRTLKSKVRKILSKLQLIAPTEETMPPKETTRAEVNVLIQPTQKATTEPLSPQDPTTT